MAPYSVNIVLIAFLICIQMYTYHSTTITCESGKACVPDCTIPSCQNAIIDATQATSLILDCVQDLSCQNAHIKLPISINRTFVDIGCIGASSCKMSTIVSNNNIKNSIQSIQLECDATRSCDGLQFDGTVNNITNFQLGCNRNYSCNALTLTIHANSTDDFISIDCVYGKYSCAGMHANVIINYMAGLVLTCAYTPYACYHTNITVHAVQIEAVYIHCLCASKACISSTFYVSADSILRELSIDSSGRSSPYIDKAPFYQSLLSVSSNYIKWLNIYCHAVNGCNTGNILVQSKSKSTTTVVDKFTISCYGNKACQGFPFNITANTIITNFSLDCYQNNSCTSGILNMSNKIINSSLFTCHNRNSCNNMSIYSSIKKTANFTCTEQLACSSMTYAVSMVSTSGLVSINCSSDYEYACYGSSVIINDTTSQNNVSVVCNGFGCNSIGFYIYKAKHVDAFCDAPYSCSVTNIIASSSNKMDMYCNANNSCNGLQLQCPYNTERACIVHCDEYDNVCKNITVSVPYTYYHGYFEMNCINVYALDPCDDVTFHCLGNDSYYDAELMYYPYQYVGYQCNYIDNLHCCPFADIFVCQTINCHINCQERTCVKQIIDATRSDELIINCINPYACFGSIIKCPAKKCSVVCSDYFACYGLEIRYSDSAADSGLLTIVCESVQIACINMTVIVSRIETFSWLCKNSNCMSNTFYIQSAKNTMIECTYSKTNGGCYNNTWYLSDENIQWKCGGKSCISLGVINVAHNISNINWDIDACNACNNSTDCVKMFQVKCGDQLQSKDNCYNPILSTNNCGCRDALLDMRESFSNNMSLSQCNYINKRNADNNQIIIIICISVGSLFILCIICIGGYKLWEKCKDEDAQFFDEAEQMLQR
eukprot:337659_1